MAVIALVVMSTAFAAMMSVSAIRNAIWNTIVEWYDKYISIDYKRDNLNLFLPQLKKSGSPLYCRRERRKK